MPRGSKSAYTGCATVGCDGKDSKRGEKCPKDCGWVRPANDGE